MWPDNETDVDLLGFQVHSDLIRNLVTDARLLPVTAGVFGDWGSGKSSIMKMLKRDLETQEQVACIYFNGWQFEGYDDAKSALIHSILLELGEHRKLPAAIKNKVASLLKQVDWLRLFNFGYQALAAPLIAAHIAAITGVPVPAVVPSVSAAPSQARSTTTPAIDEQDLQKIDWAEVVKDNHANKGLIGARQFRRDFASLIGETNLVSLVILIDDLDRCEPRRLVETLEAIKLFLAVPHTAFVIGADERIVRYAIAKRYETGSVETEARPIDRQSDLVTDYLEKLVQIPYHLPRLSISEIETYMTLLFCQLHLKDDFAVVHEAFLSSRREDITNSFRRPDVEQLLQQRQLPCPPVLTAQLNWCSGIALALGDILKGNPRQTKRLLNALLLRRKLAEAAHLDLSDQVMVKLMLLEYIRPELFGQLYQWQAAQQGVPKELQALEYEAEDEDHDLKRFAKKVLEQEPRWGDPTIRTWLLMPPSLRDQDLRNYFWITRDRLTGILVGVSAIPLHLRKLLTDLVEAEDSIVMPETKLQIGKLTSDELNILLDELSGRLQRESGKSSLIKTWIELAKTLPAASPMLVNTLERVLPSNLDASVAMMLTSVAQEQPDVHEKIVALLKNWQREPHTRIGRAAVEALQDLDRSGT